MTAGIVVGLVIGAVYVAMVRHSLSRGLAAADQRGVRVIQFGSVMRLMFTGAAFEFATKTIPGLNVAWALLAAVLLAAAALVGMTWRGVRM